MRKMRSRVACLSAAAAAALTYGVEAQAQNRVLIWDLDNGANTLSGNNGSGDWDTTTRNWFDGTNRVLWINDPTDSISLGGTNTAFNANAETNGITIWRPTNGASMVVKDITLGVGSNGGSYHLFMFGNFGGGPLTINGNITKTSSGGQLQLNGDQPVIFSAGNHVIALNDTAGDVPELLFNTEIQGSGDITVDHGAYQAWGTIEANKNNPTYTGKININKGRIALTVPGALGSTSAGTTIGAMGTLSFGGAGSRIINPSMTLSEPITITRNTYTGGDFGLYPAAIISYNGTGTNVINGPFVIDSTDARVRAQSSTLVIASNITTGANAASVLTVDGDTAGFVRLTGNNVGIAQGGVRVQGGELLLDNENQRGGPTAPLQFTGGYVKFNGGYKTNFTGMNVNFGSFNGGLDIGAGETFTINENLTGGALSMRGTGTLNINGTNALTAASFYDGGVVNVNGQHSIGGLRMRNATMNVTNGASLTTTANFTSIAIDGGENATVNLYGNAKLSARDSDFNVSDNANTTGTLNINDTAAVTVLGTFWAGKSNNAVANIVQKGGSVEVGTAAARRNLILGSSRTLDAASNVKATGNYVMSGGSLHVTGEFEIGDQFGGIGSFTMTGGTVVSDSWNQVGRFGGQGTFDMSGGTYTNNNSGGGSAFYVGESNGPAKALSTMKLRGNAVMNIQNHEFWVANGNGSQGQVTVSDTAKLNLSNWVAIGRGGTGTLTINGGTVTKDATTGSANAFIVGTNGGSGNGTLTQTAGTLKADRDTWIAEGGTGLVDLSGGTTTFDAVQVGRNGGNIGTLLVSGSANVTTGAITVAAADSVRGTISLNGGSLTAASIAGGGSTGAKTLNFNGGTLRANLDGANLVSGVTANVLAGGAIIDSNAKNVSMSQALLSGVAGDGGLNKLGAGVLTASSTAHTYTGGTAVNGGTLKVTGSVFNSSGVSANTGGTFDAAVTQKVRRLTVAPGGSAVLSAAGTGASVLTVGDGTSATSPLVMNAGSNYGNVDIVSNGLVVDVAAGGETSALTTVRDAARSAYANGTWTGNGLRSASVTQANRQAIGYALPNQVPATVVGGQFYGVGVDNSSVVVRTTVAGDATLDSLVNFDDLLALAKNYNQTNAYWVQGDFTYDAVVNFDDLLTLAKNYNQTAATAPVVAGASAEFNADVAAAFAAAVPEPGTAGILGGAVLALAGGRRRRRVKAE